MCGSRREGTRSQLARLACVRRSERERLSDLRADVAALYRANRRQGHAAWCDADYDYVCPSPGTYPYQWFWDSCFHAIVLSHLDIGRAEAELRTLLLGQQPDGFIPHVTYWSAAEPVLVGPYQVAGPSAWQSASMQPPVLAEAVAAVAARGRGSAYLREVLPAVRRYYDWCDRERGGGADDGHIGLIAIFDPHESGMDQTPSYDELLGVEGHGPATFERSWRRIGESNAALGHDSQRIVERDLFVVRDVAVNALYAENRLVLARLLAEAGDADGAEVCAERGRRTLAALLDRSWSLADEEFHALAGAAEHLLPAGTVAGLLPLVLADLPDAMAERLSRRLEAPDEYGTAFPVASVSLANPAYRRAPAGGTVLWRGPSWMNTNWYLARGLRRHGRHEQADRITQASLAMVERSGFREHYDAESGAGYGARGFAWSALVLDLLVS